MSPAVRPVVRIAWLVVAFGVALVGYRAVVPVHAPPNGVLKGLWTVGYGESEASVERKLGKPVRSTPAANHERCLRFEGGGEAAEVFVDSEGVVMTRAYPSVSNPYNFYKIVRGAPSNPTH